MIKSFLVDLSIFYLISKMTIFEYYIYKQCNRTFFNIHVIPILKKKSTKHKIRVINYNINLLDIYKNLVTIIIINMIFKYCFKNIEYLNINKSLFFWFIFKTKKQNMLKLTLCLLVIILYSTGFAISEKSILWFNYPTDTKS